MFFRSFDDPCRAVSAITIIFGDLSHRIVDNAMLGGAVGGLNPCSLQLGRGGDSVTCIAESSSSGALAVGLHHGGALVFDDGHLGSPSKQVAGIDGSAISALAFCAHNEALILGSRTGLLMYQRRPKTGLEQLHCESGVDVIGLVGDSKDQGQEAISCIVRQEEADVFGMACGRYGWDASGEIPATVSWSPGRLASRITANMNQSMLCLA